MFGDALKGVGDAAVVLTIRQSNLRWMWSKKLEETEENLKTKR